MKCYPVHVPGCPSAAQNYSKNIATSHGGNGQFAAGSWHRFHLIGLLLCAVLLAAPVAADTIDAGSFTTRYTANIHGAATDLSDYQVKFVLYNVTGTDSSENIHLPGIAQPTFNDVRFALGDGTELSYWMETLVGTENATFWVKVPSIPAGYANTVPVDIYYGNPTIGSAADGDATFSLFDNFEGSSLDTTKWTLASGTGASVSNSQLALTGSTSNKIKSNIKFSQNASLKFRGNLYGYTQYLGFRDTAITTDYVDWFVGTSSRVEKIDLMINSVDTLTIVGYWSTNEYRTGELSWNSTYVAATDGVNPLNAKQGTLTATLPVYLASSGTSTTRIGYYDWVFVRQLADTEPSVNEPAAVAATDLTVTGVSSLVPRTANTVIVTIANLGTGDAGVFKANLTLNGTTTTFDIASLAATGSTTISVTDPVTTRVLGDTVPLTIELDTENIITETNEANNTYSVPLTVVRGGTLAQGYYMGGRYYTGYDIETRNYTEGHVALLHSWGDSGYKSNGEWASRTVQWTAADLPVPSDAKIRAARLYQSYTWNNNGNPGFTVQFNGNTIEQAAFYSDGPENNPNFNGQAIYDVTPYFSKDGNTALITAAAPGGGLYATVLVVIYEDTIGQPYRKIWLDEGCDSLLYGDGTGFAMFNDVTTSSLGYARLSTVLPSGADNAQGTIGLNSQNVAITGAEGTNEGQDPGFKYYDVTGALHDGTNELAVTNDGYMNLAAAILELTYEAPPATSFSASATSGTAPLPVQFTDTSYGAASWKWDFNNDGTIDSTDKNPVYTYTAAGTFTVNLTATNAYGSANETKTAYITVTAAEATSGPVVAFTASATTGTWPLAVQFTDESAGIITARSWDFGDYSTPSAEQNPLHTYTTAGTYNVTLSATSAEGTNTTVKKNFVTVSPVTGTRLLLTNAKNGTVSGDLYVGSFQPVPFAAQPTSDDVTVRDFDQRFAIPTFTDIQWARLYVNVYSGSGSANWPSRTTVSLDGNGDGTYETVLGVENMSMSSNSGDGKAYWLNDHTNRVYSDYETEYDVTSRITSTTPSVHVKNEKTGTLYDGRLKAATLVVAYNDGDTDQVRYFVNHGGDWFSSGSSSTTFGTAGIANGFTDATLSNVGLSSSDATYSFNGVSLAGADPVAPINYYENHTWSVTSAVNTAASSVFQYSYVAPSFKTTLATLAIKYPGTAVTAPVAAFLTSITAGPAPLSVQFTDQSATSPTAWSWDFNNDGTVDSTEQSPTFSYTTAGIYTVKLTVTNASGSSTITKQNVIAVSAGPRRLTTIQSGTVSGDLYVGAYQPVAWSSQSTTPGLRTFTQAYTLPAHNSIQWARLYAAVYAAGTDNRAGQAVMTFDGDGDGTYETALGTETLAVPATNAADVYPVNDHVNRQYSDYLIWYDVTPYINANTVNAQIVTQNLSSSAFDGRLKTLTLVVAYNDGDSDQVQYWVNDGHDFQTSSGSAVTTTFATGSLASGWTNATLKNVGLSSQDAIYTLNGNTLARQGSGLPSFAVNEWNASALMNAGSDTSFTYLHNTSSSYKTILATLAVESASGTPPSAAPVAAFTASPVSGSAPLTVVFTDTSTNTPTSWHWDFGDSNTTNATVKNPVHTYAAAGTYTVNLTATNALGSDYEVKTGHITVSSAGTNDLAITGTVDTVPQVAVFAKEPNTVTIPGITNTGTVPLTNIRVALYASDVSSTVPVNTSTIATLAGSGTTDLSVTDPTIRNLEGGTVTYTAKVDPDNLVAETSEINNAAASDEKPVKYNGYKGKLYWEGGSNITTRATYDFNGGMIYSTQSSTAYKADGWSTRTETWGAGDLSLPGNATIENVFLYISYNWDRTSGGVPDWTAKFNGNTLSGGTLYTDKSNFGSYANYIYGLYRYDVTSRFSTGGNSLVMTRGVGKNALYPSTLVIIYSDPSATRKQIFINEECDELLYSEVTYGTTLEEATAYAPFTGMTIDTGDVRNATLYSFAGSAGPDEGNLFFNGNLIGTNAWQGTASTASAQSFDVKSALAESGNEAAIQGTTSGGMNALQQILVVEYTPSVTVPVAAFTANVTSGNAELAVKFTDRTKGTPASWSWDFGDGSTSTEKNPVHTYGAVGTYTVRLTATNALGTNSMEKAGYITATLGAPIAAFNATKTDGDTPFTAQFTDKSARLPSSWSWDFGDSDTTNATSQNPVHTYTSAGSYTVKLTAGNAAGSNTATRTGYINVNAKVIVEKEFNLAGVDTEDAGGSQNVSIDTSQVAVNTTGSVVTIEGIGNGWSRMDLTMNGTPEIGTSTVNGTITEVKAVGQNITVPIPSIGSPKVHLELALDELPGSGASITETITRDPTDSTFTSFTLAATTSGKNIDEIAYTVNFTKNGGLANAGDGGIIRNATVYFAISPAWVAARGGTSKIVILHMNEAGLSTLLPTTYLGPDADGNDLFSAISEEGLSTFALATVSAASSGGSSGDGGDSSGGSTSGGTDSSSTTSISSTTEKTGITSTDKKKGKVYDYALADKNYGTAGYQVVTVSQKGRMVVTPLKATTESMPEAKASWSAEIVNDPDGGGKISTGIISSIPENVIESYRTTLAGQGLDVAAVAYAMSVEKDDRIGATKDGVIEMTTPQKWVTDNGGISQIRVFRVSDEGVAELLTTTFSKYDLDTGYLTFRAESPNGLCTFTLLAVKPATGDSTAAQVSAGVQQLVPTETTVAPATGPETSPSLPLPALIVAVAGVVIVIMGVVIGKRWWERRQNPALFRED